MGQCEELILIFIAENEENFDLLDQGITRLEAKPDNRGLLDEIYRAFHTLKGNSGVVGMPRFEKVAQITEEVLAEVRDGKRKINSEVITFLLDSLDQLKILHKAIVETGTDGKELKIQLDLPGKMKPNGRKAAKKTISKRQIPRKKRKSKKTPEDVSEDGSWGIFTDNLEADKKLDVFLNSLTLTENQ